MSDKVTKFCVAFLALLVFFLIVINLFKVYDKTNSTKVSELQQKQEQKTMYDFCMSIENPTRDPLKVNCEEYLQE